MKFRVFRPALLAAFGLVAQSVLLHAACPHSAVINPDGFPSYQALNGAIGSDIRGHYWRLGSGATDNSGSCPVDGTAASIIQDDGLGNKRFTGDWQNACNLGCAGPNPNPSPGTVAVFLMEQRLNEGAVNHSSRHGVTQIWIDSPFAPLQIYTDRVQNGTATGYGPYTCYGAAACVTPLHDTPIPWVSVDPATGATYNHATGTGTVLVSFSQPDPVGYYYDAPSSSTVITGYRVYQYNGESAPTSSNAFMWSPLSTTLSNADCTAGICRKLVTVNTVFFGMVTWFALGLNFEDGSTSAFVSGNSIPLAGPTGVNGLPSRLNVSYPAVARPTAALLRWTTTNETQIAGFNLFASRGANTTPVRLNTAMIAAAGLPHLYEQTVTRSALIARLGASSAYFITLQVQLRDGTTRSVAPQPVAFPRANGPDCGSRKPGLERPDCGR